MLLHVVEEIHGGLFFKKKQKKEVLLVKLNCRETRRKRYSLVAYIVHTAEASTEKRDETKKERNETGEVQR